MERVERIELSAPTARTLYFTKVAEPVAIVLNRQRGKLSEKPRIRRVISIAAHHRHIQRYAYDEGTGNDEDAKKTRQYSKLEYMFTYR